MRTLFRKLLSFLVPAAIAVGFLLWWFSPTQTVIRTSKAILDTFEVRALTMGSRSDQSDRLAEHLAMIVKVTGPDPIPTESFSKTNLIEQHERYQRYLMASRISSGNYSVRFPKKGDATAIIDVEADIQMPGGRRNVMRYQVVFHFLKVGKSWLLREIRADLR